jgi:hypothetical protein
MTDMDQWLVRTSKNWIAGPYPRSQLCEMIQNGHLTLHDEVCAANGYWIYLHESEEVKKLIGIDVPLPRGDSNEEVTETQADSDDDTTDTEIRASGLQDSSDSNDFQDPSDFGTTFKRSSSHKQKPSDPEYYSRVEIMGQIERPSFWKGFIWILIFTTGLMLFLMFQFVKF